MTDQDTKAALGGMVVLFVCFAVWSVFFLFIMELLA